MFRVLSALLLCSALALAQANHFTIRGRVIDKETDSPIIGCAVKIPVLQTGTLTNAEGVFVLSVPKGRYQTFFYHVAYEHTSIIFQADSKTTNDTFTVRLLPEVLQKPEVKITGKKNEVISAQEIQAADLQRIPTGFNDVLRDVTILSGVVSNNELSSAYNVHGGAATENLIYLNGYEFYRPFLLKQGSEENQTMINPDMVKKVEFFNGAFPADLGDKMSSALSVQYNASQDEQWKAKARASLMNSSFVAGKKMGNWDILAGGRYAYPDLFLNSQHTSGSYHPFFADFQLLTTYTLPDKSKLEFFGLISKNTYNLTPSHWTGYFAIGRDMISAVDVNFSGKREYSFSNSFGGLKYTKVFNPASTIVLSVSEGFSTESEYADVTGEYFYVPDADNMNDERQYLKNRYENADNTLKIYQTDFHAEWLADFSGNAITAGAFTRLRSLHDIVNEHAYDISSLPVVEQPINNTVDRHLRPNEYGIFILDNVKPRPGVNLTFGFRGTYVAVCKEYLVSPRLQVSWLVSPTHTLFAGWGYYYQPPYYLESRNNDIPLISQRAIHYSIGWENKFKSNVLFRMELFYKKLDNLIPYYTEGQKVIYTGTNSRHGFATGADVLVQGEVVTGLQSWIGYGLLFTQDKPNSGGSYIRRLSDQTHSLLIFLQDHFKRYPNWQVHTRFLAGSGQLYFSRSSVYDSTAKKYYMQVNMNHPEEYFLYLRVDMGCSAWFEIAEKKRLTVTAEILNIFNHNNYASYQFVQAWKDVPRPIKIPEVLTPRFLNIQVELEI